MVLELLEGPVRPWRSLRSWSVLDGPRGHRDPGWSWRSWKVLEFLEGPGRSWRSVRPALFLRQQLANK